MRSRQNIITSLSDGLTGLTAWLRQLPLLRLWLNPKTEADRAYEARIRPKTNQAGAAELSQSIRRERFKTWLRATVGSLPFVVGTMLLFGLLIIFVAGPAFSPHSPYTTHGIATIDGEISVPPFSPSSLYPWGTDALGRDMMSLVLSGAQQTLTLVGLVMLARLAVGFVLGVLAGWQQDRFLDRVIMAINQIFAALPTLIFAMILVLALGIRRGIWVFVVALCFVGWGEMMQFIRSEVIVLRKQLYVESATALGARFSGIVLRHMLPNLLPALISLAALEMGAIAMLLGELGFIGIFIGGGTFSEAVVGAPPYHYSDVPEWGALLSNVRIFARGYPWTAIPPAAAFFLAILAFNLFGEGLRRLVQDVGLSFNRFINRYTLAVVVVLILGLRWVESNTGSTVFIKQLAQSFDQAQVTTQFETLTDPTLEARALGTPGLGQAADYIAAQFESYGLQPGGKKSTYFFDVDREYLRLTDVPHLAANNSPSLTYREDFAEIPTNFLDAGSDKSGELVVLLVGDQVFAGTNFSRNSIPPSIQELDLGDKVVLLLGGVGNLPNVERQGTLILTRNPDDITHRDSLSAYSTDAPARIPLRGGPFFYVSEAGANKLLAGANVTVQKLAEQEEALGPNDVILAKTGVMVSTALPGEIQERVPARHVIGYWPGHDENLDDHLLVVLAQYDGLGVDVRDQLYPGANETASGVAVMLELLRSWHESGFQPKKTIIFVAYVGEGFDRNQFPNRIPDVERFTSAKFGFAAAFTPEAFIFLDGVGAGSGRGLTLAAGGNIRLAQTFETAARQMGVRTARENQVFDLDLIFGGATNVVTEDAPTITLAWTGADAFADTPADTPAIVDPVKLAKTGKVLSLALGLMSREVSY